MGVWVCSTIEQNQSIYIYLILIYSNMPSKDGRAIEASTYGNPSTFCKKKILYRMRPVFRASLWPDQWSYSVPLGIKWKIWTLSFHWYPLVSFGFSGSKASQSQAFFPKVENAENWPTWPPNFHGKKEACWFVEPLLRYQSLKSGLILYTQKPRWISMSV